MSGKVFKTIVPWMTGPVQRRLLVGFVCLYFLLGLILIPYAGIQTDEATFSVVMYGPVNPSFCINLFHRSIPLMIFPYAGALKSLLYWPIFRIFGVNLYSLRVPVLLLGAVTILLSYRLLEIMAGRRAALFAALLLSTDASFLMTNTFDWGPVALQHFLFVAGCLLFARHRPVLGSFLFGLALWNKAVFIWALSGLIAATAVSYFPAIRKVLANRRAVILCVLAFALGASPLFVYNFHAPNATLRANVHPSLDDIHIKLLSLNGTLNGDPMFGFIAAPEYDGQPKAPRSLAGHVSCWLRDRVGRIESSLFVYAIVFACLAAPLWWRDGGWRAGVFAIVFIVVAFMTMALVRYTGAAHHIVLLYPIPHLLAAIGLSVTRPRWLRVTALAVLIVSNLLVVNQYISELERNGSYRLWTDAFQPLSDKLAGFENRRIYTLDLGMEDNLNLTEKGRLQIKKGYPLTDLTPARMEEMIADRNALFLNHVPSVQYFTGIDEMLGTLAKTDGFQRRDVAVIRDSNSRPQFELFVFDRVR
jgi:hypothetical protein